MHAPTRIAAAATLAVLSSMAPPAQGDSIDEAVVAKVKSAYLLNFMRFSEWPSEAFADGFSPLRVVVIGEDPLGPVLDRTVASEQIRGRRIVVERIVLPGRASEANGELIANLSRAHVVFVGETESPLLGDLLGEANSNYALTVGNHVDSLAAGAMLVLNVEADRVVFYANHDAVRGSRTRVSSKMLELAGDARAVRTAQEGETW